MLYAAYNTLARGDGGCLALACLGLRKPERYAKGRGTWGEGPCSVYVIASSGAPRMWQTLKNSPVAELQRVPHSVLQALAPWSSLAAPGTEALYQMYSVCLPACSRGCKPHPSAKAEFSENIAWCTKILCKTRTRVWGASG